MNNQILNNNTTVYYAILVEGKVVSQNYATPTIADIELSKLPLGTQAVATVEAVDVSGRQLLLG